MRDILVTAIIFGSLPFILKRPYIGVLMWIWVSVMSPHRLTYGFAFSMPFAQIVGITLLVGFLLSKEAKRMPWSSTLVVWMLFVLWMCVSTRFAFYPDLAEIGLEKSIKIQVPCFLSLMIINSRYRLNLMVWILVLSLAFFGTKGGVFTILNGGDFLVWGPEGSFIEGNNELALSLVTIVPLLRFLQLQAGDIQVHAGFVRFRIARKWVWRGLLAVIVLCIASVIGSSSRGAFLALSAMGLFLLWKSPRRAPVIALLVLVIPMVVVLAPDKYWSRMSTIKTYEEDGSAMGRINAWKFAINMASDNPLTGGGFNSFQPALFRLYAPNPEKVLVAHSNYFQVLAEHGYVGLFLYLLLALLAWRSASWTVRAARGESSLQWHTDLARMSQVSLIGYSVGGAFLSLSYFDLYYYLISIILLNRWLVAQALQERMTAGPPASSTFARGVRGPAGTTAMQSGPRP